MSCWRCVLGALILAWSQGGLAWAKEKGDALDQEVISILESKCVRCHDDRKSAAAGGVDNLRQLDEFYNGYGDDRTLVLGPNPRMPRESFKEVAWNGAMSPAQQQTFASWIQRGGPSPEYLNAIAVQPREPISEQAIVQLIAVDLGKLSGAKLKNARYLTITNLHNNSSIPLDQLEVYRRGLVKMLNSLSRVGDVLGMDTSRAPHRVVAIDEHRTVFRFDLSHIGWSEQLWDRVANHYPYALLLRDGAAKSVYELTSSKLPYLRADWFVFATSQPPLYHELAGIPTTLAELEKSLGIDRIAAIRELRVARAGFENSKVSYNNRLLERIVLPSRGGAFHISYDFASNDGVQNFFENPFGPLGAFNFTRAFRHDGGEVIFPLPNGFSAYALVAADGKRLDVAPQAIVYDDSMPGGAIINGISCIACHYQGMKPEAGDRRLAELDQVRAHALSNFRDFNAEEREIIAQIYKPQEDFASLIEQDRLRFINALAAAGLEENGSTEPVRALFDRFIRDLDINAVAADFGQTPSEFRELMQRENETRQLLQRIERGTLKRQLYLSSFETIARLTGAGEIRKFERIGFPYFGEKAVAVAERASEGEAVALQPSQSEREKGIGVRVRHGLDLLDAENRESDFQVKIWTENDQRRYREGEAIPCFIRANRDCYLTIVAVNPTGEIVTLVPNKWTPELKVAAGQTLRIPEEHWEFELAAQPPHGLTELKVIATKTPLRLPEATPQRLQQEGVLTLGRSKGIGLRPKLESEARPTTPSETPARSRLNELFLPNEWATASWTLTTTPP